MAKKSNTTETPVTDVTETTPETPVSNQTPELDETYTEDILSDEYFKKGLFTAIVQGVLANQALFRFADVGQASSHVSNVYDQMVKLSAEKGLIKNV